MDKPVASDRTAGVDKLRIGVIGAGNIATIAQLPSLARRTDVELAALVSRSSDPRPTMRRWSFGRAYRTVEEMIESASVAAAIVLTPRGNHVESVRACLSAGLDVFCEKPLATRASDAHELAELAQARSLILMVGFNRRFAPVYRVGREAFVNGPADFCVAQKNRAGSEYRATFENAIHMVDLLRWYCGGEPESVSAHALAPDPWREDGLAALVRFSTGATGCLVASRDAGGWDERLDAYGSGVSVQIEAPDRVSVTRDGVTQVSEARAQAFGWATATQTFGFQACIDHFVDRVRDRAQPLTSGAEAAATQDLLDRILAAAGLPTDENPEHTWSSHATK